MRSTIIHTKEPCDTSTLHAHGKRRFMAGNAVDMCGANAPLFLHMCLSWIIPRLCVASFQSLCCVIFMNHKHSMKYLMTFHHVTLELCHVTHKVTPCDLTWLCETLNQKTIKDLPYSILMHHYRALYFRYLSLQVRSCQDDFLQFLTLVFVLHKNACKYTVYMWPTEPCYVILTHVVPGVVRQAFLLGRSCWNNCKLFATLVNVPYNPTRR